MCNNKLIFIGNDGLLPARCHAIFWAYVWFCLLNAFEQLSVTFKIKIKLKIYLKKMSSAKYRPFCRPQCVNNNSIWKEYVTVSIVFISQTDTWQSISGLTSAMAKYPLSNVHIYQLVRRAMPSETSIFRDTQQFSYENIFGNNAQLTINKKCSDHKTHIGTHEGKHWESSTI